MAGNKNMRLLKVVVPVAAICLLLYALYEYRQAAGEVDVQTRHLRESQEEYKTLTKRFDILSHELKTAVQATADLDKQLKLEKKNRLKLESEKSELERQFETEGVRRNNENKKLSKEKQQLAEEKVDLNRQLDRLNARLQTLSQEMTEQGDSHSANEKKLKQDCKTRLDQQTGKMSSLSNDLTDCRGDQNDMRNRLEQCKEEVVSAAAKYQRNRLMGNSDDHRDGYRYSRREDNFREDGRYRREDQYNPKYSHQHPGAGPSLEDVETYHIAEDPKQRGHQRGNYRGNGRIQNPLNERDPKALDDQGETHHINEKKKKEIYDSLHKKLLKGEELSDKERRAYRLLYTIYGAQRRESLEEEGPGVARPAGENKIHGRRGGPRFASSSSAPPHGDRDPEVKDLEDHNPMVEDIKAANNARSATQAEAHDTQQAQAPPAPANNANNNNNEQEEIKDLLDGQQKLDNAKDSQKDAGAGEQKADQEGADQGGALDENLPKEDEEEDANVEGQDPRHKEDLEGEEGDNQDQPLQKPVPEGGEKKLAKEEGDLRQQPPALDPPDPVGNGHDDDEDAANGGDYNKHDREEGEDERNRVKEPAKQHPDDAAEDPDGRQAFLRDQETFEQERLRNLEKEPRKGLAKEKQEQVKAMENELKDLEAPKKRLREMR